MKKTLYSSLNSCLRSILKEMFPSFRKRHIYVHELNAQRQCEIHQTYWDSGRRTEYFLVNTVNGINQNISFGYNQFPGTVPVSSQIMIVPENCVIVIYSCDGTSFSMSIWQ